MSGAANEEKESNANLTIANRTERSILPSRMRKDSKVTFGTQITLVQNDEETKMTALSFYNWLKKIINIYLDNKIYVTIIVIFSIWTVFNVDLKNLLVAVEYDIIFETIITTIFLTFVLDFILSLAFKDNYFWTFYCIFDLVSFLSLIPDCPIFWNSFLSVLLFFK